jgi:limonene-1,2-epoxide hydrolase
MAGYLDQYGVAEARREGRLKRIILVAAAAVVVAVIGYFTFRTWGQERVVNQFLATLSRKDYQSAYRMWGCTPETPCKFYDLQKFDEDWGPKSSYANADNAKVDTIDYCDAGVVFDLSFPGADPVALYVERSTNIISFAPWPQCPGRHWQFRQFFKKMFS